MENLDHITAENMRLLATKENDFCRNILKQIEIKSRKRDIVNTELLLSNIDIGENCEEELESRGFVVSLGGRFNEINTHISWK